MNMNLGSQPGTNASELTLVESSRVFVMDKYEKSVKKDHVLAAAPHTITIWGGFTITIDKWCTVSGKLHNQKHHHIKIDNDERRSKLDKMIRYALHEIGVEKKYEMHISGIHGADGRIAPATVLFAVFTFINNFEISDVEKWEEATVDTLDHFNVDFIAKFGTLHSLQNGSIGTFGITQYLEDNLHWQTICFLRPPEINLSHRLCFLSVRTNLHDKSWGPSLGKGSTIAHIITFSAKEIGEKMCEATNERDYTDFELLCREAIIDIMEPKSEEEENTSGVYGYDSQPANIVLLINNDINAREKLCSRIVSEIAEQVKTKKNFVLKWVAFEFLRCASSFQIVDHEFIEGEEMNKLVYKVANNKRQLVTDSGEDSDDDENELASKKSKL